MENKANFRFPHWHDLPTLELYMDQVRIIIDNAMEALMLPEEQPVTATMINNYVKIKLITPPVKKKYSREHLARLIIVSLLKRVISLQEIAIVMEDLFCDREASVAYDLFCDELEQRLAEATGQSGNSKPTDCPALVCAAVHAVVGKILLALEIAARNANA